jgi:SAM-dependent methyltransferase
MDLTHRRPDHDGHPHQHPGRGRHRVLDLDAEVFADQLTAVLDRAGVPAARSVVDLGAGSGAGSRLLRERYPDAVVTCVDNDPDMLELLRAQGFAVVGADLDEGFPELVGPPAPADTRSEAGVDLVWASSALHHVAHPAQLLVGVRRALASGGVLVVVELDGLPSFLRDPREAMLEQRCHAAAAADGWNHHPDWTPLLASAGFDVRRSELSTVAPVTPAAREYAQQWFARFSHLAGLSGDDRDAVEDLVARSSNDLELEPRVTRTVWVATAGQTQEQP